MSTLTSIANASKQCDCNVFTNPVHKGITDTIGIDRISSLNLDIQTFERMPVRLDSISSMKFSNLIQFTSQM